ncbi:MAG: cytochrome P460 family protein [Bacteroidetes bacterium]|nr:cytochrome P460 family protein [Bacteroidota bacterium]MBL0138660.1 cytochrome P460 family protein [Bacteroidota bacterium]
MKNKLLLSLSIAAFVFAVSSCSREKDDSPGLSDNALISLANSNDLVNVDVHSTDSRLSQAPAFRIRMNHIAADACNDSFHSLPAVFPASSVLVKEYLDASGTVTARDVMYKAPADSRSDGGWLWASYDADGQNVYSASRRGSSCNSCHSGGTDKVIGL